LSPKHLLPPNVGDTILHRRPGGRTDRHFDAGRSIYRRFLREYRVVCSAHAVVVRWFAGLDAKDLSEAPPAKRGDEQRVTALCSFDPAEVEETRGYGRAERSGNVRLALGPIEAGSGNRRTVRMQRRRQRNSEATEKPSACGRDMDRHFVEDD